MTHDDEDECPYDEPTFSGPVRERARLPFIREAVRKELERLRDEILNAPPMGHADYADGASITLEYIRRRLAELEKVDS